MTAITPLTPLTKDAWLATHPFLQPVADFHATVSAAAAQITLPRPSIPDWNQYAPDFQQGVPLLQSAGVSLDVSVTEPAIASLVETVTQLPMSTVIDERQGLLRYLACTMLSRYLRPVVDAFSGWRDEDRWLRNYCPTCGAPPAMAQLIGVDPGRLRLLSCGCCHTRWRYRRTGCPFCDDQHEHRLSVLAIEGEAGLRIDYCDRCRGYLKTYDGHGSEDVLLADWTSMHLDVLAKERGLKRCAASLYDF
jgi:FdhE protein